MRAFVTSIGEKTTDICADQLSRFGFDVVVLSKKENWADKYRQFIDSTEEDCIRVDADVLVNERVKLMREMPHLDILMAQGSVYDFFHNDSWVGQPVYYSRNVFKIIRHQLEHMNEMRPESWAWRLADVNKKTISLDTLMGMHGFFCDEEQLERAYRNKESRGQLGRFDFDLARKLIKLK